MKTVYFIYVAIPYDIFDSKIKYMISNPNSYKYKHDKKFGLYAWTTKKSLVKNFLETRVSNIYTFVDKEVTDEFLKDLKSNNGALQLEIRDFEYIKNKKIKHAEIISTKDEWRCSCMDAREYIEEFKPIPKEEFNINIYNSKVFDALDKIGYISDYMIYYGNSDEIDFENYNLAYGVTGRGNCISHKHIDNVNVLLYLFHYLFYGTDSLPFIL